MERKKGKCVISYWREIDEGYDMKYVLTGSSELGVNTLAHNAL